MPRPWSLLTVLLLGGCGGSVESKLCTKLDECNALSGTSVDECSDDISSELDDLSSATRADCENQIKDCLEKESCDDFLTCSISDCDFGTGFDNVQHHDFVVLTALQPTLVTEEEFLALPSSPTRCELLDGEVVVGPTHADSGPVRRGAVGGLQSPLPPDFTLDLRALPR